MKTPSFLSLRHHRAPDWAATLPRLRRLIINSVAAMTCLFTTAVVAIEPVSTDRNGVAAGGHDVAAYHQLEQDGQAIKGNADYSVTWKGATWRFVRASDMAAFKADPKKFSPAFNGHCANALALGEGLIPTSGRHWVILDDQLYFFFARRGALRWLDGNHATYLNQAKEAWLQNIE